MTEAFKVKIGINPISWSNDDLPSLGGDTPLEVALAEGKAIGYQGFELGNKFPRESKALAAVLAAHGLELVSGWYSGRLARRSVAEEIAAVAPHLKLLAENGATVMVYGEVADSIQGAPQPLYKRPRFVGDLAWREYAHRIGAFARHTLARGVRLAYHHHMGAYVQSPSDVDKLMALTGDEVGLLFDSGHMSFAGGDAVAMLTRHIRRVCHVHCKDMRPQVIAMARNRNWTFLESVINGAFTVPGDGALDFASLLELLHRNGYQGWLVVEAEQDPSVAPSYRYAELGYRHLHELVARIGSRVSNKVSGRMSLLVKGQRDGRDIVRVTPQSAGWTYVGFAAHRLAAAEAISVALHDAEACIVVMTGKVTIETGSQTWRDIGDRDSVFDDRAPYAVYLPPGETARIVARTAAEIAIGSAPAAAGPPARLIAPGSMKRFKRGEGSNTRYVCDILPQTEPASHLLLVEVVTPAGHSSSYPPHKHDTDNLPAESSLEETYYHRLKPAQGFAFQRVYTDDRSIDEALAVEDHDVVLVPRGYHPVVVPHGYDSYYLNVMAGPKREWHFKNDPAHEWMLKR
jgi:myo-inosose-2 dehydratase/5-deoxy-glucuronate isomerase